MTLKLDRITKNLSGNIISIELYQEDDMLKLFISDNNSSGCKYTIQSVQDVTDRVCQYLYSYDREI